MTKRSANGKAVPHRAVEAGPGWSIGERSEAEQKEGPASTAAPLPNPEVLEKPVRRKFDAAYKIRILRETDAAPGLVGAILRKEGLYSSHLTTWRRQREMGELAGLEPRKRGRKGKRPDPTAAKLAELERENRRLRKRLETAELIIDIQKKVAAALGTPLDKPDWKGC